MLVRDQNPPFSQACSVDGAGLRRVLEHQLPISTAHLDCLTCPLALSGTGLGPWCQPPCTARPGQGHSPLLPTGTTWPGSFQPKASSGKRKGKEDKERRQQL